MREKIILASKSPRRRELVSAFGMDFEITAPSCAEKKIEGERPVDTVRRLAKEKAESVLRENAGRWVLAADTVVALDGRTFGKPKDVDEAKYMLSRLAGRAHSVFTGVALAKPGGELLCDAEETVVRMRKLSRGEIDAYVARGESMDKAGAYAAQGAGALLIERIEGCYPNVVGLPLSLVCKMFESAGISLAEQWGYEKNV